MESSQHITRNYVLFIKNFLVNFGYTKYCKLVNNITDHEMDDYQKNLMKYLENREIWDKLFDELYYPFKYFCTIVTDEEIINNADIEDIHYNILTSNTTNIYKHITFQEYIDSKISLKLVGATDYTTFTKNMNDEKFRNNLISQYEIEMLKHTIKNHLIYLIQLQVKYMTYNIEYLTETEQSKILQYVDVIPYFEYLGKNNWCPETIFKYTIEEIESKQHEYTFEFSELERTTLSIISNQLF